MQSVERVTHVKLKADWMGNMAGTILNLPPKIAEDLYRRDAAELYSPQSTEEVKEKMQKIIKNKMIKSSTNK